MTNNNNIYIYIPDRVLKVMSTRTIKNERNKTAFILLLEISSSFNSKITGDEMK